MSTPPFATLPPANVRLSLGPEEWEACLDAWLTLAELILRLPPSDFSLNASDHGTLPSFLTSFYSELGTFQPDDWTLGTPKAQSLRKACFRIVSRTLLGDAPVPLSLLTFDFLSSFCHAHLRSDALRQLMARWWKKKGDLIAPRLQKQKDIMITALDAKNPESGVELLRKLAPVIHGSSSIGTFFMTGTDFLDALVSAYSHATTDEQKKAIASVLYLGLLASVRTEPPTVSLLSDHLYSLKSHSDKSPPDSSLLADVVTNTSLLTKLRYTVGEKAPDRLLKLLDQLETYRTPSLARAKTRVRRSQSTAKGKQPAPQDELNVHQLSLVTQVQDLFPDLGSGFVLKLLDEYNDDVEQVTAHLLDESLPAHLSGLDRGEQAAIFDMSKHAEVHDLAPRSTPQPPGPFIPDRRNAFDGDELDQIDFDTSRLHIGKRNKSVPSSDQPNKAAIMSALAAFDSDDDERDDTYDVDDVGGTIDNAAPDGEPGPVAKVTKEENDMALFTAYKSAPEIFGRAFDVRKSQARQALKAETSMSDEQIEGWAVMLQRDPKRLKRLEAQTGSFDGRQTELASTAYRGSAGNTETEDSDVAQQSGRGGFRGRARGRGRGRDGRGGGNVAGSSNDSTTANAQRKKEANKSSRANHNRRDQRARKLARGGFPV